MTSTISISGVELRQYILASPEINPVLQPKKSKSFISLLVGEISEYTDPSPAFSQKYHNKNQFQQHFNHRIRPIINNIENDRVNALRILRKRFWIFLLTLLGLTVTCIVFKYLAPDWMLYVVAGLFICILASILWLTQPARAYTIRCREKLNTEIISFFGEDYEFKCLAPSFVETLKPSGIIPAFMSEATSNLTSGSHSGIKFSHAYSKLINHHASSEDVVFSGLFVKFVFPNSLRGNTVVKNDKSGNWLSHKFGTLEQVEFKKPSPEKGWKIYSTNPEEARNLLSPTFLERLTNMASLLGKGNLEFSFYENNLLLMIPLTEDKSNSASVFTPHPVTAEINEIIKKQEQIMITIDQINLEQKGAEFLRHDKHHASN